MIEFVEAQLERARAFLGTIPRAAEQAAARALNAAAAAGRDAAVTAIGERYAVSAGAVREKITTTTASPDSLSVSVIARSGSIALGNFPHTPQLSATGGPGRPVLSAEVLRGQQKDVGGAFVATINGKPRIMVRTGGKTGTGKTKIKSVYTVPIAVMMGASSVVDAVEDRAMKVLDERLDREIDRALAKDAP